MSLVALCSGKGAPGTTFAAINLAAAMTRRGDDVLLLDLDAAGGDVAAYLGLDTRHGIYPLLRMDNGVPEPSALLAEADERHGFRAVCGFPEASALSTSVDLLSSTTRRAADERTVLCDLGRISKEGARLAAHTDLTLLVVRPDLVSVLGAERALRRLETEGASSASIAVLESCVDRRRPADVHEVGAALGAEVIGAIPIHPSSARKALLAQVPVPKGPIPRAFDALAATLSERLVSVAQPKAEAVA